MDIRFFFKGIGCFVTGLTRFYSDRTLLKYALFPFILMLVTHFIFLVSTVLLTAAVTAKLENWLSGLPVWISKTLSFVSILGSFMAGAAVILVSLLTFSTFFELFAGPFFDCLIKKYEKKYHGTDTDDVPLRRTLRFWLESACYAVNTLLILLILFLPAFLLPVPGQLLLYLTGGYRMGTAYMFPAGFLKNRSVKEQLGTAKNHKAAVLGFGLTVYLLFLLPLAPVFLLPGVILGGVELQYCFKKRPSDSGTV